MTNVSDNNSMAGLNHQNPSSPQYNLFDSAAAELTLAKPNITKTTLGRQHIEAIIADPEIIFIRDFFSPASSVNLVPPNSGRILLLQAAHYMFSLVIP